MNPEPCPGVGLGFIPSEKSQKGIFWMVHWWVLGHSSPSDTLFKFCLDTRNIRALPLDPACPERWSVRSPAALLRDPILEIAAVGSTSSWWDLVNECSLYVRRTPPSNATLLVSILPSPKNLVDTSGETGDKIDGVQTHLRVVTPHCTNFSFVAQFRNWEFRYSSKIFCAELYQGWRRWLLPSPVGAGGILFLLPLLLAYPTFWQLFALPGKNSVTCLLEQMVQRSILQNIKTAGL